MADPRAGVEFLVRGNDPHAHQLGGLGSAVRSPVGSGAKPWPPRAFGAFYYAGNTYKCTVYC